MALLSQTFIGLPPPLINQPAWEINGLGFSYYGFIGVEYLIEYTERLRDAPWLELVRWRGIGGSIVVLDQAPDLPAGITRCGRIDPRIDFWEDLTEDGEGFRMVDA